MADVIAAEDYEDCADENNKSDPISSAEIIVTEISDPQTLLNDTSEESTNESEKDSSDMTLKQEASEPELFATEDLIVNPTDLLPPVERLEKYANSDLVFNRQVVACKLLETLRIVHEDTDEVARVVNVLCSISEDYDPTVRSELMVQLPHIVAFCKEVKLNNTIVQYLLPMFINYLGDEANLVRRSSHSALITIIEQGLLEFDIISEKICPLVLHLTDSIHPEDIRTESINLMSKLVVLIGKKVAEDLFFERLFALCTDKVNNVRKACALTFGDICTTVGRETTEEVLLPKFFALCEDSAWCVRKACAEIFMPVSCVVSRETRCKELANLYLILLSDASRWVRLTAYQALGPFISTFAEPDRTGLYYSKDGVLTVVDKLCSMVQDELASTDKADVYQCNGDVDGPIDSVPSDANSSLDRTNSSISCDSVVPLCNTDTNHSASDVPGISCHVGNNCSVIEASTMTSPSTPSERTEAVDDSSSHCDSKPVPCSGDTWTVFDASNGQNSVEPSDSDCVSNTENNFNDSLTDKQKEFNKIWYEAIYGCENGMVNGAVDSEEMTETVDNSFDVENSLVLNSNPEEKSLDPIAMKGRVKSFKKTSNFKKSLGPVNGEVLPVVAVSYTTEESSGDSKRELSNHSPEDCANSEVLHSTNDSCVDLKVEMGYTGFDSNEFVKPLETPRSLMDSETKRQRIFGKLSHESKQELTNHSPEDCAIQHSTGDSCNDMEIKTGNSIPTQTFSAQELNNAIIDSSVENDSEESVKLKVSSSDESSDSESAFNHFQYWRDPLPDVDIEAALQSLSNCSVDESSSNLYRSTDSSPKWLQLLDQCTKPKYSFEFLSKEFSCTNKRSIHIRSDDLTSENKGEPPPAKLLCPYDQDIVPPELLLQYLSMIDASWAQSIDVEIARHCAYSLPAVALTLGRQFWPCLKETFDALSSDLQGFIMMWKVRRTVASAMHQLAVILGPHITSRDLLPVFSRFINDLDEVRVGILQHLYEFLKVLRPEERKQILPSLPEFLVSNSDSDANEKNWRFRLILAEQLVTISELYEPMQVRAHLVPLSLTLIKDKVCEVRLAAVRVMASVMKRLSQSPTTAHTKSLLTELTENFVHSPKWLHRQLYVYVCQEFIMENSLSPDQFAEDALPQLLYLCWDRVPNVRIAIARCLVAVIWPLDIFSNPTSPHRELLLQTIHTLQSDMDADVRFYANMVSTHECSCLQNGDFTNVVEPFV